MTAFTENIRKIMGWCPNTSTIEARKSVPFDDPMVNVPGSGGELIHTTAGWWNKYRNLALLVSIGLTILSIKWFISPEINNMDFLLAVLFTGIFFGVLARMPGFDSLNKIASSKSENTLKLSTKRMLVVYILGILSIIAFSYLWSIWLGKNSRIFYWLFTCLVGVVLTSLILGKEKQENNSYTWIFQADCCNH
jgi:Na+/melibiose symporter-like transporter